MVEFFSKLETPNRRDERVGRMGSGRSEKEKKGRVVSQVSMAPGYGRLRWACWKLPIRKRRPGCCRRRCRCRGRRMLRKKPGDGMAQSAGERRAFGRRMGGDGDEDEEEYEDGDGDEKAEKQESWWKKGDFVDLLPQFLSDGVVGRTLGPPAATTPTIHPLPRRLYSH